MMVKCWNCNTDFEVVSSAENTNKHNLSATHIAQVLKDNMFDATRGTIVVNINDFIDEVAEILERHG